MKRSRVGTTDLHGIHDTRQRLTWAYDRLINVLSHTHPRRPQDAT